jgi:Flp pilus assembly protein TadB
LIWLAVALFIAAAGACLYFLSVHPRPGALILLALLFAAWLIAWGMQTTRRRDIEKFGRRTGSV